MERHVGKAFVLEGLLISCNVIKDVIGLIMKHKSKEVVLRPFPLRAAFVHEQGQLIQHASPQLQ